MAARGRMHRGDHGRTLADALARLDFAVDQSVNGAMICVDPDGNNTGYADQFIR